MKQREIELSGNDLGIKDIVALGRQEAKAVLSDSARKRCQRCREYLDQKISERQIIYGVNTSFGPMCNKIISDEQIKKLQINLIKSHAAGLGQDLAPEIALAAVVVRLNTLAKGYSGVRVELLEFLLKAINSGIAPCIPECGSVGASGDLVHLAHLSLMVIGRGKVYYKGVRRSCEEVLDECGIAPLRLSHKEGISLINGTSAMTAVAAFALYEALKLYHLACVDAAFSIEIFGGYHDAFDRTLHNLKPHPGQLATARLINKLIEGSRNTTSRSEVHKPIRSQEIEAEAWETDISVQDVYSIRCTAQVLAPVKEALDLAISCVETEANSTNDNPVIIPDKDKIIHGGNFHGQSISFVMDILRIGISTLCNLSERRLNKLLDRNLNEGLPENLISGIPGLDMGFMGAQYLSTSTTAENRHLANPVSTQNISSNESNQDVVSMGTISARKTLEAVNNAKHILTLETLADLQALSFRNASEMSDRLKGIYEYLRADFEVYDSERIFHEDLVKFRKLLFDGDYFLDLDNCLKESIL